MRTKSFLTAGRITQMPFRQSGELGWDTSYEQAFILVEFSSICLVSLGIES